MTRKSIMKTALALFALLLLSNVAVSAQKTACPNPADADIVKTIYDRMKKKTKLDQQIMQVNVTSRDGVVTLKGWARSPKDKKEIEKIARKMNCGKAVVNELADGPMGCSPGQKRCGTICIPQEEICNICTAKTCT